jgi:CcmD family protein
VSEWNYVVAAYGVTWIALLGYMAYVAKRYVRAEAAHRAGQGGER